MQNAKNNASNPVFIRQNLKEYFCNEGAVPGKIIIFKIILKNKSFLFSDSNFEYATFENVLFGNTQLMNT